MMEFKLVFILSLAEQHAVLGWQNLVEDFAEAKNGWKRHEILNASFMSVLSHNDKHIDKFHIETDKELDHHEESAHVEILEVFVVHRHVL